ncbi:3-deoxy-7-phosphoheptulonate synthase [Candidatus Saccharibacteria bacterium]|nr:3-deoxy-7-phosphoheptulonate synthase [Candidatus Saccharibacteria bacterium]
MSIEIVKQMPTAEQLRQELPLNERLIAIRQQRIDELKQILAGEVSKLVVIVGPCSADSYDPVMRYAENLAQLNEQLSDRLFIVPRVYTYKPRTNGMGYKGLATQPSLRGGVDLLSGIRASRRLHRDVLRKTGLITADEMLYPSSMPYLDDLLGYVAVGARSVENQEHRLVSSGLDMPIGMKNPTSGDLPTMLNSIHAAQQQHDLIYDGEWVKSSGNPYAHAILRGGLRVKKELRDEEDVYLPNYQEPDLLRAALLYVSRRLQHPSIIIDTNHANSGKDHSKQPDIVDNVLHSMKRNPALHGIVKGFMIESYLCSGKQDIDPSRRLVPGKSVTDGCLGWEDTEYLLRRMADTYDQISSV